MRKSKLFKEWGVFHKGMDADSIERSFANHLEYSLSKDQYTSTLRDLYHSLALAVRDRLIEQWIHTQQTYHRKDVKRVYYLSAEYLMGRALVNNLINLGIYEEAKKAIEELNLDFETLVSQEPDAGLGNGGLGRLAACFMDSLAALEIPAFGYGIRYEYGIFEQAIKNLEQVELPDNWLKDGDPWEIARPEYSYRVQFYGRTRQSTWPDGSLRVEWIDTQDVVGMAYDMPIAGYDNITVNTLRLWSSKATKEFDLTYFQHGDYFKAVEEKNLSENISKVLYPNDNIYQGKELRLKQQYFFVSCSVQDIIRRYLADHDSFDELPDKAAIQLNDTHPSLAIVELMRIFLDYYKLPWEKAWDITVRTCAYTNHTILPEALEEWPVEMFGTLLPRHLELIYEINRRFLKDVSLLYPGDTARLGRVSIIREEPEKKIRMANLAIIGSNSVNGVAELHTKLLKEEVFKDFDEIFPGKINNKTNGITPRRWLLASNQGLASLISEKIGKGWIKDLSQLKQIEPYADDANFQDRFFEVKHRNKENLTLIARALTGTILDPSSIFDVQVKRIHEYKRQLLNILHVVYNWLRIKETGYEMHPRTFIFAGKAAPGYFMAKLIIKLICHVADALNDDPTTKDFIKVVFLPNYRVTLAEQIIPAADLSEQISTAGYEASGTGNMKLALNGALTIGTLDGANVEISEEVGQDNMFIFGLRADEVLNLRENYDPREYYASDPILRKAIDLIGSGFFSPAGPDVFKPIVDNLLGSDNYLVLADFDSYRQTQEVVNETYINRKLWTKKAILNVARMGKFSSDRTILEYNRDIWHAERVPISKEEYHRVQTEEVKEVDQKA